MPGGRASGFEPAAQILMGVLLKFLLTILVFLVVWWVVKFRGRVSVLKAAIDAAKKVAEDEKARAQAASAPVPAKLVACLKCGTYIAAGAACSCEKV